MTDDDFDRFVRNGRLAQVLVDAMLESVAHQACIDDVRRFEIAQAMQARGGSCVQALGAALQRADPHNARRLELAFPEFFAQYSRQC